MSPSEILLIARDRHGKKVILNLWEAIEAGRLYVRISPFEKSPVVDCAGEDFSNRMELIEQGAKEVSWDNQKITPPLRPKGILSTEAGDARSILGNSIISSEAEASAENGCGSVET